MTRILDGARLAKTLREEIRQRVSEFAGQTGVTPKLATLLIGADPASKVYIRNKHKACEAAGILSVHLDLPETIRQQDLLSEIDRLNNDPTVHGILTQFPLPKPLDERSVVRALHPLKDVDCFHPENVGLLVDGSARFLPCTPAGVLRLLERDAIATAGRQVVVLGRSNLVGRPLSILLSQKGADATVTLCHSQTKNLADHARRADILVAAIGRPEFVTADMVRPGAVVVDVGINRLADGRLVGDVDFDAVGAIAGAITPVPGGIGPLTVTMLLENTLTAAQHLIGKKRPA